MAHGRERGDGGQTMVLVLVLLAAVTLIPVIVAHDVINEYPILNVEINSQQAQVAAEAGIQHYRNLLDNIPNYWQYYNTTGHLPPANEADLALTGWDPVVTGSNESYHYIPNTNCILTNDCDSVGNPDNGDVILTVIGRAGNNNRYSYASLTATFRLSGILNDSYYSEYELLDPEVPDGYPTTTYTDCLSWSSRSPYGCTSSTTVTVSESQILVPTADDYSTMAIPISSLNDSLLMDLCAYHTFEVNGYITNDNLDGAGSYSDPGGPTYNTTTPYYGPFFGSTPLKSGSFTLPASTPYNPTDSLPSNPHTGANQDQALTFNSPCNEAFNFKSGENFSATVYTNDQVYTDTSGGNPVFSGTPPLDSGAKNNPNYTYAWAWPGAGSKVIGHTTVYYPKGWIDTAGGDPPTFSYPTVGAANQILPEFDSAIAAYANGTIAGQQGCLFTGPTMIEFVPPTTGATQSTMNVWSPLTVKSGYSAGNPSSACGTYSPSSPWQTGISLPADGVIYVQSVPSKTTDPNYWSSASLATADTTVVSGHPPVPNKCLDPYTPNWFSTWAATPASSQCPSGTIGEGDVIIEGELKGQVTLASDSNVIISRDVTYNCADGAGAASQTLPAACSTATGSADDILGIAADADVVLSHPTDQSDGLGPSPGWVSSAPSCGSQDGTTLTAAISSGASATTLNSYIAPTCDIKNPIADMATVALGGSLGVENYDQQDAFFNSGSGTTSGGGFYVNGTDISFFRGPFGTFDGDGNNVTGYNKELTYDTRLGYVTPPYFLGAVSTVWNLTSVVVCGTENASVTGVCTQVH
jgi:hypothetical protein